MFSACWNGELVALKVFTKVDTNDWREITLSRYSTPHINTFSILRHPNIMKIVGVCTCNGLLGYMMPLYSKNLLQIVPTLDDQFALKIAMDVAKGLDYLHQLNTLHRDLKPQNILVRYQLLETKIGLQMIS